ncbi:putative porin, partial [Ideonella sp.]|uniref:putative porin n=1 Tax=Ideonella sp. TaxID=1929293 RepID=UPI003BB7C4E6
AKAQIKEDIRNDVLATAREEGWADARKLPGWVRGLSFSGDVRTRAQGENFAADNVAPEVFRSQTDSPAWAPDLTNTRTDRKRMTVRARVAVAAKASDSLNAGVRITTGSSTGSPTSASQTAGNGFNRYGVSIDRAFIRWEPSHLLRMEAGRMAVPFDHTDLLFPDDLSLDGVAAKGELDLASGMFGFAVAGAFPLEEFASTARDKYLLGGQMGLDWALDSDWKLRAAVGLYEFRNIEGERESALPPTGALAGTTGYQSSQYLASVRQKGNTLINLNAPGSTASPVWGLASKFRPVDLTLSLTARHFMPYELGFVLNVVKNTAFDKADIARRAGTAAVNDLVDMTNGYQMRLNFGAARMDEPGAWSTYLAFRKFERDAWVDAYTDTTWHLGGTNYKGFSLGGLYAFDNKATLGARLTSTRNLDDGVRYGSGSALSGNLSSAPLKIDVVQVDVNFRF